MTRNREWAGLDGQQEVIGTPRGIGNFHMAVRTLSTEFRPKVADRALHRTCSRNYFLSRAAESEFLQVRPYLNAQGSLPIPRFPHSLHTTIRQNVPRFQPLIPRACGERSIPRRLPMLCCSQGTTKQVGPRTEVQLHCAGALPTERTRPTHEQGSPPPRRRARRPDLSNVRGRRGTHRASYRRPDRDRQLLVRRGAHMDDQVAFRPRVSASLTRVHVVQGGLLLREVAA